MEYNINTFSEVLQNLYAVKLLEKDLVENAELFSYNFSNIENANSKNHIIEYKMDLINTFIDNFNCLNNDYVDLVKRSEIDVFFGDDIDRYQNVVVSLLRNYKKGKRNTFQGEDIFDSFNYMERFQPFIEKKLYDTVDLILVSSLEYIFEMTRLEYEVSQSWEVNPSEMENKIKQIIIDEDSKKQ